MGQPAYDYKYSDYAQAADARRQSARPARQTAPLRVEQGGKRHISPLRAAMQHGVQVVGLGLLAGFAVALLFSEARIVELSGEIRQAKAELVSAQSQNDYYATVLNVQSSIENVEEAAARLGLMKVDDSQITYVRLNSESVLTRTASPVQQWTSRIEAGVSSLITSIEAPADAADGTAGDTEQDTAQ